jgi:hypothetical protein
MKKLLVCFAVIMASFAVAGLTVWAWRFDPPAWVLTTEIAVFSILAMAYGFSLLKPHKVPWLWLRPVRGTVAVVAGVVAMFVPLQFLVSAFLIGIGIRMVWASASELTAGTSGPLLDIRLSENGKVPVRS